MTQAVVIGTQAQTILSESSLAKFYDPSQFDFARNEMALVHQGQLSLVDRLVISGDECWVHYSSIDIAMRAPIFFQASEF